MHDSLKDFDSEMWPPMLTTYSLNQIQGIGETLQSLAGLLDYTVIADLSVLKS